MAITVLRYNNNGTSAGAPALSGSAGSLITVLDFCLVTTLGWTKTAGTNNGIYRAPTGNRRYLANLGLPYVGATRSSASDCQKRRG
mgnify:CR=1 FL=1